MQAILHPVLWLKFHVAVVPVEFDDCLARVVFHLLEVLVTCERVTLSKLFIADVLHYRGPLRFDRSVRVYKSIANVHVIETIRIVWHLDDIDVEGASTCLGVFESDNVALLVRVRDFEWSESFSVVRESVGQRCVKSLAIGTAEKTIETLLADGFIMRFSHRMSAWIFVSSTAHRIRLSSSSP